MELKELQEKALADNIPIMQDAGLDFMVSLLNRHHATSLLEIGTAVGYSSIYMASHVENLKIDTIERDENRYSQAVNNIDEFKLQHQIHAILDDALEMDLNRLSYMPYDCLFIDAAKAQYQKFFEKYVGLVKENGVIIVDNLDFHGMIFDIKNIHNRNTRQLVRKIKRFKDWILNNEDYESTYYPIGDGVVLIRKKEQPHEAISTNQ